MCTYVGPNSGASTGRCTQTPGYIAEGGLYDIYAANTSIQVDQLDDRFSNKLVYDKTQWVAWMNPFNKALRT